MNDCRSLGKQITDVVCVKYTAEMIEHDLDIRRYVLA